MKKVLMTLVLVELLIITCFLTLKNVSIAGWTSKSIKDIKEANKKLSEQTNIAMEKNKQEYPDSVEKLEQAIKLYETTKANYESKIANSGDVELGMVQIKRYKIETLWITIENYAKARNIELLLNVVENTVSVNSYNLEIAVVGEYSNIVDFLYDIEKDENLNFKIENFEMHQYRTKTTTTEGEENVETNEPFSSTITTKTEPTGTDAVSNATDGKITVETPNTEETISYDPKWVEATFVINNVEIDNVNGEFN